MHRFSSRSDESADLSALRHARKRPPQTYLCIGFFVAVVENLCMVRARCELSTGCSVKGVVHPSLFGNAIGRLNHQHRKENPNGVPKKSRIDHPTSERAGTRSRRWLSRWGKDRLQVAGSLSSPSRAGLEDGLPPARIARQTPRRVREAIYRLRRRRMVAAEIAARLGLARSTVARILQQAGWGRLKSLEPAQPARRYERHHPGQLLLANGGELCSTLRRPGAPACGSRNTGGVQRTPDDFVAVVENLCMVRARTRPRTRQRGYRPPTTGPGWTCPSPPSGQSSSVLREGVPSPM